MEERLHRVGVFPPPPHGEGCADKIDHVNPVWSTYILYVRPGNGFAYLTASDRTGMADGSFPGDCRIRFPRGSAWTVSRRLLKNTDIRNFWSKKEAISGMAAYSWTKYSVFYFFRARFYRARLYIEKSIYIGVVYEEKWNHHDRRFRGLLLCRRNFLHNGKCR